MRKLRVLTLLFFMASAAGFGAYQMKYIKMEDNEAPVISYDAKELQVSVENSGDEILLQGVRAQDNRDGDVSNSLVVVSRSKFKSKGKCEVSYAAFDEAGNVGAARRTLIYEDYVSPHFELSEPLIFAKSTTSYVLVDKVTAEDCLDGDISNIVKYSFGEDKLPHNATGVQQVVFQVTNSSGDTVDLPLEMEILSEEDFKLPYPELTDYLVYTKVGEAINPTEYIRGIRRQNGTDYRFNEEELESFTASEEEDMTYIVKSSANLRQNPGTDAPVLRTLDANGEVEVIEFTENAEWAKVKAVDNEGYVKADLLEKKAAPVEETKSSKKKVRAPYTLSDITINSSEVDYTRPGVYKIRYSLSQEIDEETGERESLGAVSLFVVVEE